MPITRRGKDKDETESRGRRRSPPPKKEPSLSGLEEFLAPKIQAMADAHAQYVEPIKQVHLSASWLVNRHDTSTESGRRAKENIDKINSDLQARNSYIRIVIESFLTQQQRDKFKQIFDQEMVKHDVQKEGAANVLASVLSESATIANSTELFHGNKNAEGIDKAYNQLQLIQEKNEYIQPKFIQMSDDDPAKAEEIKNYLNNTLSSCVLNSDREAVKNFIAQKTEGMSVQDLSTFALGFKDFVEKYQIKPLNYKADNEQQATPPQPLSPPNPPQQNQNTNQTQALVERLSKSEKEAAQVRVNGPNVASQQKRSETETEFTPAKNLEAGKKQGFANTRATVLRTGRSANQLVFKSANKSQDLDFDSFAKAVIRNYEDLKKEKVQFLKDENTYQITSKPEWSIQQTESGIVVNLPTGDRESAKLLTRAAMMAAPGKIILDMGDNLQQLKDTIKIAMKLEKDFELSDACKLAVENSKDPELKKLVGITPDGEANKNEGVFDQSDDSKLESDDSSGEPGPDSPKKHGNRRI